MSTPSDFIDVTEVAGDEVSAEQVARLVRRYHWAGSYCEGKDVVEVACGSGQGAGLLQSIARSFIAGDCSQALLTSARRHYGSRIDFREFSAEALPIADGSTDVVVILEAIYYVADLERFFVECKRVLRPGGWLLIATANKDLFDFNPSPESHTYLGIVELGERLGSHGFFPRFYGDTPIAAVGARQRVLRPAKAVAARIGLIPKSMNGKKVLKRLVFGSLVKMPPEISGTKPSPPPVQVPGDRPDKRHKVLFCAAQLATS